MKLKSIYRRESEISDHIKHYNSKIWYRMLIYQFVYLRGFTSGNFGCCETTLRYCFFYNCFFYIFKEKNVSDVKYVNNYFYFRNFYSWTHVIIYYDSYWYAYIVEFNTRGTFLVWRIARYLWFIIIKYRVYDLKKFLNSKIIKCFLLHLWKCWLPFWVSY